MNHTLLEALPVAIYTTDAEGRITFFNEAAVELWGYRPELGSSKWCGSWRLFTTEGRPLPHEDCPMAIALREGRKVLGMEAVAERPDGTRIVFAPYPVPLKDDEGRVTGGINLLVDVTQRKEVELSAARLAAIVSSSDDAIISKNLSSVITSWNEGATRIFGYEAEEVIGRSVRLLIPPEMQEQEDEILGKIGRGERVEHFDTVRLAKNGERIEVSLTISPILDNSGRIVGASKIARDVRERKGAEELQRLLFNELNHRVKNTLSTIQAIASQSMRATTSPREFVSSFNDRVGALSRAHNLLVEQQMRGTSISRLIQEQVVLGDQTDRVVCSGPDVALDARITVQMALVLHELATNARKYGALSVPTGKLTICWEINMQTGRELRLEWQESGLTGLRAPRSRGFGTTLIERCLEANHGEASLRFGAEGLTCKIRLPLPEETRVSVIDPCTGSSDDLWIRKETAETLHGKRILVVEDEPLVAMDIQDELQTHGFEVIGPALHIEGAKKLIAQEHIDAALLDANLSGKSSGELATILADKSVPFAFATGYGPDGLPAKFADAKIIAKPFPAGHLIAAIHQLLNNSSEPDNVVSLRRKRSD